MATSLFNNPPYLNSVIGNGRKIASVVNYVTTDVIGVMIQARRNRAIASAKAEDSYKPKRYEYDTIPIDVKLEEKYSYTAEVTNHVMENATIVTDHVILEPLKISLTFEIVNYAGIDQVCRSFAMMTDAWQQRKIWRLVLKHTDLPNMICTNLEMINSAEKWGALQVVAAFQQVNFMNISAYYDIARLQPSDFTGGPNTQRSAQVPGSSAAITGSVQVDATDKFGIFQKLSLNTSFNGRLR